MNGVALLDQLLEPLALCLDPVAARRIAELHIDPAVQERVDFLAERANEGSLTSDEQAEYEALINAADFIAVLKLKARGRITPSEPR